MGDSTLDGPLEGLSGEEAVDEAGGEGISAADAVEDVDVALRDVGDLGGFYGNAGDGDRTPGVIRRCMRGAQGGGRRL